MEIADIIFDDEREGIVPVGTILADAAKRFGVDLGECLHPDEHSCEVVILKGAEQLSKRSVDEIGYFENSETDENRRLACFVKIVNVGEIKVMSAKNEKSADETNVKDSQDDSYRKEFAELPLEKKIANLVHLEAITFTETLAFVVNSPFTVIDKIGDVLAEFGLNKETAEKQQKRAASETKSSRSAPRKRKSPPKPDAAI